MPSQHPTPSFFTRLRLAFRVLGDPALAERLTAPAPQPLPPAPVPPATAAASAPAPADHASGLTLLALLQREGRLVDFLQEDVSGFQDAEIGAAARVVHAGTRKALHQYFTLEPILPQGEGESVAVKAGFDAQRIRLTGNITGQPPFRGTLRHHGWVATEVRLPTASPALDPRVVAPAEVEL